MSRRPADTDAPAEETPVAALPRPTKPRPAPVSDEASEDTPPAAASASMTEAPPAPVQEPLPDYLAKKTRLTPQGSREKADGGYFTEMKEAGKRDVMSNGSPRVPSLSIWTARANRCEFTFRPICFRLN